MLELRLSLRCELKGIIFADLIFAFCSRLSCEQSSSSVEVARNERELLRNNRASLENSKQ